MWQFTVDIRQTKNISKNFIPEMAMRWYSGPNSTAEASKIRKLIMGSAALISCFWLIFRKLGEGYKGDGRFELVNGVYVLCPMLFES